VNISLEWRWIRDVKSNTFVYIIRAMNSRYASFSPTAEPGLPGMRGFTLIELMIVLAIAVILLATGVPSFVGFVQSVRLGTTAGAFMTSVRLARSEAARRGGRVVMCRSAGEGCAALGGWEQGWMVFHDANNNAEFDAGEPVIEQTEPVAEGLKFSGNQNVARYISFVSLGGTRMASGGFQAGTLTLCRHSPSPVEARQIVISSAGRFRLQRTQVDSCE
jgi:type IV fimbrial biogenesis protein FimT